MATATQRQTQQQHRQPTNEGSLASGRVGAIMEAASSATDRADGDSEIVPQTAPFTTQPTCAALCTPDARSWAFAGKCTSC